MTGSALSKEFIRSVLGACMERLVVLGMRKRRLGIGTWRITDDVQGWIGLNTETRRGDGTMIVNPSVGVRFDRVQSIVAEVKGVALHPYLPPTVSTGLGYQMPQHEYVPFVFVKDESVLPVAAELAEAVAGYGLPYMRERASLESLVNHLPSEASWEDAGERLLAVHSLLGRREEIARIIRERSREGKAKPVNVQRFEAYSKKFLKYVARAEKSPGTRSARDD